MRLYNDPVLVTLCGGGVDSSGWKCRRRPNSFFFVSSFLSCEKCSKIYPLCDGDGVLPLKQL